MYRKDYLIRLLEEAAKVLSELLLYRNRNNFQESEKLIDYCYADVLKIDREFVLSSSVGRIIESLGGNVDFQLLETLSQLLYEEAVVTDENDRKLKLLEKSNELSLYLEQHEPVFSLSRQERLHNSRDLIAHLRSGL